MISPMIAAMAAGSTITGSFMSRDVIQPLAARNRNVLAITASWDFGP